MNSFNFSMNSGRENTVALSSWQGGHHFAPQYRNTGLFWVRAVAKGASTLPPYQAIAGTATGAGAGALAAATAPDADGGGAVCCAHPATIKPIVSAMVGRGNLFI